MTVEVGLGSRSLLKLNLVSTPQLSAEGHIPQTRGRCPSYDECRDGLLYPHSIIFDIEKSIDNTLEKDASEGGCRALLQTRVRTVRFSLDEGQERMLKLTNFRKSVM